MINIAELLKDAPKGMKLYSPLFGEVEYMQLGDDNKIWVKTSGGTYYFDKYGKPYAFDKAECLLFPSEHYRTWEAWKRLSETKYRVGDWLYHNKKGVYPILITDYDEKLGYQTECLSTKTYLRKEFVEKEYHLWSIEDAKDGDVLVNDAGCIFINAGFEKDDKVTLVCYCYVSVQGIFYEEDYKTGSWLYVSHVHPATKEQRDLLFKKMKEAGYQWDADKKELHKIIEPKFKVGTWLWHKTKGVFPMMVEDYDEKEGYLMQYLNSRTYFGCDIIENEYRLWVFGDSKPGDILYDKAYNRIGIFENFGHHPDGGSFNDKTYCYLILYYDVDDNEFYEKTCNDMDGYDAVPATKEQRDLLFKKMKEAGYEWDADKKELRKIKPHYDNQELELPTKPNPKFKVGDDIKTGNTIETIAEVGHATRSYYCESGRTISFENQDLWHLVPKPHYDIANFKAGMPVLVRDYDNTQWRYVQFSHCVGKDNPIMFNACGNTWEQCIPFEGNETLLGTTDMCNERFINW